MSRKDRGAGKLLLEIVASDMHERGVSDVPTIEPFEVCGVAMHLRTLSAERRAALWSWMETNRHNVSGLYARLIAWSAVTEAGEPVVTQEQAAEIPAAVAEAIVAEITKRNKLDG